MTYLAAVVALLALSLPARAWGSEPTPPIPTTAEAAAAPSGCSYSQPWFPYWAGQGDVPRARLRVLANGEEIVNKTFCINELWVWLGDLREEIKNKLENTLVGKSVSTQAGTFTVQSMAVHKAPFETLLVSMQFQQGGELDLLALTKDVEATAAASGTVSYLGLNIGTASGSVRATLPKIIVDGVHRNLTIEEWETVWPGAHADTTHFNFSLGSVGNACSVLRWAHLGCAAAGFVERLINLVAPDLVAGIVETEGFEAARTKLEERLEPNDAVASLLGDNTARDIALAVQQAAAAIGISIPSPPCGTRFTLYVENPPSNRSSGGEVTIALFSPV